MIFSNMDIPVAEENNPQILPDSIERKISGEIPCRDPFIMLYNENYYLYKSLGEKGIGCMVSDDLKNWSEPVVVFETPENFHGVKDWFWAPECHYYNGHFYIFTSVFSSKYNHRVISVYCSKNPLGPFTVTSECISPEEWDAIDGTLYVDEEKQTWLVFVHEWTSMPNGNGGMVAAKLNDNFTELISEPQLLFLAKDAPWATGGVTDGPYMIKGDNGNLYMIWSNFSKTGYAVGLAKSDDGRITGNWSHFDREIYAKNLKDEYVYDGGHAMIFKTKENKNVMAFHTPDDKAIDIEHLCIVNIMETAEGIIIE